MEVQADPLAALSLAARVDPDGEELAVWGGRVAQNGELGFSRPERDAFAALGGLLAAVLAFAGWASVDWLNRHV
jgi:hypothetical protein